MYFTAKLSIDPSQATRIEQVVPKNLFNQLFLFITSGRNSKEEEHETFCAVAILQQFNAIFKALSMDNIIRLTKDRTDYYFDEEGKEGDIEEALHNFVQKVEHTKEDLFRHIYLVLEHQTDTLYYLIQVRINRTHRVGEYPIEIILNAVLNQFTTKKLDENGLKELYNDLWWAFDSQKKYDEIVDAGMQSFVKFVNEVEEAMKQFIGVDDITTETRTSIIHPRQTINKKIRIPFHREANLEPLFHGYYAVSEKALYAWLWSKICQERDIKIKETFIVNDRGGVLLDLSQKAQKSKMLLKAGIDLGTEGAEKTANNEAQTSFSFSTLWDELPNTPRSEYSFLENQRNP